MELNIEQERKDFETFGLAEGGNLSNYDLRKGEDGEYIGRPAIWAWKIWLARAELSQPQQEPICYARATKDGNIVWGEDCMCQDPIYPSHTDDVDSDGDPTISLGLFTAPPSPAQTFQDRVKPWLMECFGPVIAADTQERNHRFFEESLELVQACGATASEAHQLVDYVFGRPVGEKSQEVGGVMVTLAALCLAQDLNMHSEGETELARIWTKVEQIRAKQAAKPRHSPLPVSIAQPVPLSDEQIDQIMVQSQVFASAWSLVGGQFDFGDGMERAEEARAELRALLATQEAK